MRDDRERLADIFEAITNIDKYAMRGRETFCQDELIQVWIRYHFQVIGEAARGLSDHFKEEHSEIPWSEIIALRNMLIHHYFGIDPEVVWNIIINDLPLFKRQVEAILHHLT